MMCTRSLVVILLFVLGACGPPELLGEIVVDSGAHERVNTPLALELPPTAIVPTFAADAEEAYDLLTSRSLILEDEEGTRISARWEPNIGFPWEDSLQSGTLLFVLEGPVPPQTTRRYNVYLGDAEAGAFRIVDGSIYVQIEQDGAPVLRYNFGIVREEEGDVGPYDRAAYLHPVWTPAGEVITGDFSPEHIHQRGVFFAWRDVQFGELATDFWGLGPSEARVLPADDRPTVTAGPVGATLLARNDGVVGRAVRMKENHRIRVYDLPDEEGRLFDVQIRQVRVDPETPDAEPDSSIMMLVPALYYGGMSYRAPSRWLREDSRDVQHLLSQGVTFPDDFGWLAPEESLRVFTSNGDGRYNGDGTRVDWLDYTGPVNDSWAGLLAIDSPNNLRHPTRVRIHPELPYFSFAMVREAPLTISGAEPLTVEYRFLAHDGPPDRARAERLAADFATPPSVSWQPALPSP